MFEKDYLFSGGIDSPSLLRAKEIII